MSERGQVYVWRDGLGVIPREEAWAMDQAERASRSPNIIKDIEPYKSPMTGEVIGGRSHHREHMRKHGVVELGNDRIKPRPPEISPAGHDIKAAIEQVNSGNRPAPVERQRDWNE